MVAEFKAVASEVDLLVLFAVSLLGGAHCLGMCGPLVTTYADRLGSDSQRLTWREVRQRALLNSARTAGYAAVGGVAGALGGAFVVAGLLPRTHGLGLLGVPAPHIHISVYQPLG